MSYNSSKYNLNNLYEVNIQHICHEGSNVKITLDVVTNELPNFTITIPYHNSWGRALFSIRNSSWDNDQLLTHSRLSGCIDMLNIINYEIVKVVMTQQDLDNDNVEIELRTLEGKFIYFEGYGCYILALVLYHFDYPIRNKIPIYISKNSARNLC